MENLAVRRKASSSASPAPSSTLAPAALPMRNVVARGMLHHRTSPPDRLPGVRCVHPTNVEAGQLPVASDDPLTGVDSSAYKGLK